MKNINKIQSKIDDLTSIESIHFYAQDQAIAVYTALSILVLMRKELGLEAMVDYMESYRRIFEVTYPSVKIAVKKAVNLVDVIKLYNEAMCHE